MHDAKVNIAGMKRGKREIPLKKDLRIIPILMNQRNSITTN